MITKKAYYYFDEAGEPQILGHRGVNLVEKGTASKVFMVGYLETTSPKEFTKQLNNLRLEISTDEYLKDIPSFHHSLEMFHANKDCSEVREKVFKLLKKQDFHYYCIVARKDEDLFRKKFNMSQKSLYKYLVTKLLENRLQIYKNIDLYFSSMGSIVRQSGMQQAVDAAIMSSDEKNKSNDSSNIRVFIQQSSEIPLLQASDYVLWTIQRAYERGDFRYYNYLKDKIKLIYDIFDSKKYPDNCYSENNPLEAKKIDPV